MGALVTPLTAGPEAGERSVRPWAAYASAAGFLLIALGAGVAADLPSLLPLPLLLAVAGLALLGVLSQALEQVMTGTAPARSAGRLRRRFLHALALRAGRGVLGTRLRHRHRLCSWKGTRCALCRSAQVLARCQARASL